MFPGIQGGPLMHVIAAKAVAFKEALEPEFKAYQAQVVKNAQAMAKTIISRGYKIVSGGTENHLMLVDMIGKSVTGKAAEEALGKAHITVNKNAVPNDPQKPFVTSGLRIGTPAVTTRGYTWSRIAWRWRTGFAMFWMRRTMRTSLQGCGRTSPGSAGSSRFTDEDLRVRSCSRIAVICLFLFGVAWSAAASELVLTPPLGYVENAPKGNFECARGMRPMITRVDFRRFALRNQVWQQEESVDYSGWTTGRTLSKPSVGFVKGRLKAQVYVLVAGDGKLLDKVVTCSSEPKYNDRVVEAHG